MSNLSIAAELAALEESTVARVMGRNIKQRELRADFDKVCDAQNWKLPIDATVSLAGDFEIARMRCAIAHFAGCVACIEPAGAMHRVRAVGYYAAVGA